MKYREQNRWVNLNGQLDRPLNRLTESLSKNQTVIWTAHINDPTTKIKVYLISHMSPMLEEAITIMLYPHLL